VKSQCDIGSASVYPERNRSAWIVTLRSVRARVDPFLPNGFFLEKELSSSGQVICSAGILLTNRECPWRCLMCDLWKHTLPYSVPLGAIPRQIDFALARLGVQPEQVKLYNSGSFFDAAAIPAADYPTIAERVRFAKHVIVESHPRLIGEKALRFRDFLEGSLEVAIGLETVHPGVFPRLNKRFTLDQFTQSVAFLRREAMDVRAFVLVKPPFLNEQEAIKWAVESARFAFSCGAGVVSLIPTRGGNGAMDRLAESGEFAPPSIDALEQSLELSLQLGLGRVFADTWDLEKFSRCATCFKQREQRLNTSNLTQSFLTLPNCESCGQSLACAGRPESHNGGGG
jgi:radical SAM enzyme (TIGR01210 family)